MNEITSTHRTDRSGFRYFQEGLIGEAHAFAHEMLDEGRVYEGYRRLGEFLAAHATEGGPKWVHIHWHMAVFEIGVGRVRDALERARERILPFVSAGQALTDGPSILWRLYMAGVPHEELEWAAVRRAAIASQEASPSAYVVVHNLLAFAGAGDTESIDRWLDTAHEQADPREEQVLLQLAWSLRLYANHDWSQSARLIEPILQSIGKLGGSHAQNEIFYDLRAAAWRTDATRAAA